MRELEDELLEAVARLAVSQCRRGGGVTCPASLSADDWYTIYSSERVHHLNVNITQKVVDHTLARILDSIHRHTG